MTHDSMHLPPHGKGKVRAYSWPQQKWVIVNWKYVWQNREVYPMWEPTSDYRWTGSHAHLNGIAIAECTCGKPHEASPVFHNIGCTYRAQESAKARASHLNGEGLNNEQP
jgi:hypothetical protein